MSGWWQLDNRDHRVVSLIINGFGRVSFLLQEISALDSPCMYAYVFYCVWLMFTRLLIYIYIYIIEQEYNITSKPSKHAESRRMLAVSAVVLCVLFQCDKRTTFVARSRHCRMLQLRPGAPGGDGPSTGPPGLGGSRWATGSRHQGTAPGRSKIHLPTLVEGHKSKKRASNQSEIVASYTVCFCVLVCLVV